MQLKIEMFSFELSGRGGTAVIKSEVKLSNDVLQHPLKQLAIELNFMQWGRIKLN